jgi:hypothetical protein
MESGLKAKGHILAGLKTTLTSKVTCCTSLLEHIYHISVVNLHKPEKLLVQQNPSYWPTAGVQRGWQQKISVVRKT